MKQLHVVFRLPKQLQTILAHGNDQYDSQGLLTSKRLMKLQQAVQLYARFEGKIEL